MRHMKKLAAGTPYLLADIVKSTIVDSPKLEVQ
jgi:hypothetical protein